MATPIGQLSFIPAGGDTKRGLADWSSDIFLNVKNFGALGNGSHDDADNIQACLDAAFGTYALPNGGINQVDNRVVYFPPGNYTVSKPLYVHWIRGQIWGAGSNATTITYTGTTPAASHIPPWYATRGYYNPTVLFATNGCGYSVFKGMSFVMNNRVAPATPVDTCTVCFSHDWYQEGDAGSPNAVGNLFCVFEDVWFRGGSYGYLGGLGDQTDTLTFINCGADDCEYGFYTANFNALCHTHINSHANNCTTAFRNGAGSINPILGGGVITDCDTVYEGGTGTLNIIGVISDSPAFALTPPLGGGLLFGCKQTSASAGPLVQSSGVQGPPTDCNNVIDGCSSVAGNLTGRGGMYVRGNSTIGASPAAALATGPLIGGGLREWTSHSSFTFAQIPALIYIQEGCKFNITDATTAVWGATVSTGGGSNRVLIQASGNSARGSITFSAIPDVGSTITIGNPGDQPVVVVTFANVAVNGVALSAGGSGGTNGSRTLTLVGGTGTAATFNATISGGTVTSINSIISGGSYTVVPSGTLAVTDAGLTGCTVTIATNLQAMGYSLITGEVFRGANLAACVDNLCAHIVGGGVPGANATASGSPHDTINFVGVYGAYHNAYSLVASAGSHGTPSPGGGTLAGGTGPNWTVVGK